MTSEDLAMRADAWTAGTAVMDAVYGAGFSARLPTEEPAPFLHETVEQLFAKVWSRPGLSIRDRRLLVLGATATLGRSDLIRIQTLGALRQEELTVEQLQEALLHLAYYVGWGNASALSDGFAMAVADYHLESSEGPTSPRTARTMPEEAPHD